MFSQYPRTVVTIAFVLATLLIVIGLIYPRFLMRKPTSEVSVPESNSTQVEQQADAQSASVINSEDDPDPEYIDAHSEEEAQDEATSSIEIM